MRYLDDIKFVKESKDNHYDPDLGEWVESEPVIVETSGNVTDIGTDKSVEIFGDIKQGAKVLRTMPLFVIPEYDYILFGNKRWELTTWRNPSDRNTFVLQEVSA